MASAVEEHFNVVVKIKTAWVLHGLPPEYQVRHASWDGERSLTLMALLLKTWLFECKDPRDKIFSLLGLVISDVDEHRIYPDYTKPAPEPYAQVTRYIFANWKDIGVLNNISDSARDERLPNLPSWVPDFSTTGASGMYGV